MSSRNVDVTWPAVRVAPRLTGAIRRLAPSRVAARPLALWRQRRVVGLLVVRDLKVRYASSALGYVWSILEPLLLGLTYWFVFTQISHRDVGEDPYIVFLLAGIFPWTWFSTGISDTARALRNEAKLIQSTNVPRELWVVRIVAAKAVEFFFSLPILLLFAGLYQAPMNWRLVYVLPAAALMGVLVFGIGLLLSPLVVLVEDLSRLVRLFLRLAFYASPVVFTVADLPDKLAPFFALNPVAGILELCRAGFFPSQLVWHHVERSVVVSGVLLLVGWIVFARLERTVLKEI